MKAGLKKMFKIAELCNKLKDTICHTVCPRIQIFLWPPIIKISEKMGQTGGFVSLIISFCIHGCRVRLCVQHRLDLECEEENGCEIAVELSETERCHRLISLLLLQ